MLVARPRPTRSKDVLYCKTKIASDMSVSIFPKWLDAMERMIQMEAAGGHSKPHGQPTISTHPARAWRKRQNDWLRSCGGAVGWASTAVARKVVCTQHRLETAHVDTGTQARRHDGSTGLNGFKW